MPIATSKASGSVHPGSRLLNLSAGERTVAAVVRQAARAFGDRPFVQYKDQVVSFAEADRRSDRVATAFAQLGVKKGDRVAILSGNCLEYLDILFALAKLGAVQLPLNIAYKAPQILHTLQRAPVSIVVVHPECAGEFVEIADRLEHCRHVIWLGEPSAPESPKRKHHRYRDLLAVSAVNEVPGIHREPVKSSDLVAIMNTSGTTGPSKGVLLPHGQQLGLAKIIADAIELGCDDVYYNFFPLFHNTAQAMIALPTLLTGARMILADRFSVSAFFPDVRRHGITTFYYIGEVLHLLVRNCEAEPRPESLRAAWGIGGAPADCAAFERHFGVRLSTGYGSTEANVPIIRRMGADALSASAGRVSGPFDVSIRAPDGRVLPAGEVGEVCVREREPDLVMRGYDADPAATAQALRDGWLWTGDSGRFDDAGNFYFEGRLKDVIRVRGENVSAFEIEQTVLEVPGVLEAAAVAVPSEIGGDDVKLVVVPHAGARLDPATIVAHCETFLPKFSVPRYVAIKDALPRTETNKIRKNVLREEGVAPGTWDRLSASTNDR